MAFLVRLRGLVGLLTVLVLVGLGLGLVGRGLVHLSGGWVLATLAAGALLLLWTGARIRRAVPRRTILEVDFERGVHERAPTRDGMRSLLARDRALRLDEVVEGIRRGAEDRRVVALVARVGSFAPGLAVAQEIRDAVLAFRARGKKAIAWAETIGEGRSATVETYLACAFDEVFVQPTGEVGLDGVLLDHPFVRAALDKVGVEPQLGHRREYKAAKNLFTEHAMTPAHRESAESLMASQMEQIAAGIAEGRGLSAEAVRALIDRGPFRASEAKEAGLVDGLAYRDEVYAAVKATLPGKLLDLAVYGRRAGPRHRKGATIVVIPGLGSIARGPAKARRGKTGGTMGADDVAKAIRRAAKQKRVKAIVLRVDSPGGSAVASDTIWREVKRAREEGTPVVASMGNVAASGGYYVACGADKIVALPGTITGSIGVVWGKFYVREALAKVGIEFDSAQIGANADLWSGQHPFDEGDWARVERLLDGVYDDFKARVAEGRKLSADAVEAVAKGRVWTGAQAKERGLVDALGGLERAVDAAKEVAGIRAGAPVRVRVVSVTKRRPPWKGEESSEALAALAPLAARLEAWGLLRAPGRLELPPLPLSTRA